MPKTAAASASSRPTGYGDGAFAEYGFREPEITSLEMLERSPMRETLHLQEVVRRLVRQGWRVQLVAVWVEDWGRLQQGAEEWWRWRG
ncbi:hypothetical protein [Eikenella sp. NML99-0057]|uniref:hypothetical protein n=1 Tax=Eikenella sp. NML99-0057 TaxID=1795834 RepID=UPI0012E8D654|nr:hypothetical protein [Eikenella sp. NML99-0057]